MSASLVKYLIKIEPAFFIMRLFKLENGHLIAKNPTLPNLTIVDLYNPKIYTLTKKISPDFLLHNIIW